MNRRWLAPLALGAAVVAVFALVESGRSAAADEGATPEFVGQTACKQCHFKEHKSWKKTVHAKALDLLKPGEAADAKKKANLDPQKDYSKDATCLPCHTTGYGQPGGYPEVKDAWSEDEQKCADVNEGVGCEACHGAGSQYIPFKKDHDGEYKRSEIAKLGLKTPVTAANCTGCHKAEGNPTVGPDYKFDFETMKTKPEAIHEHQKLKKDHEG